MKCRFSIKCYRVINRSLSLISQTIEKVTCMKNVFLTPPIMKRQIFSTPPWKFYLSTLIMKKCSFDPGSWKNKNFSTLHQISLPIFGVLFRPGPPYNEVDLGVNWSDLSFALKRTTFFLWNSGESLFPVWMVGSCIIITQRISLDYD